MWILSSKIDLSYIHYGVNYCLCFECQRNGFHTTFVGASVKQIPVKVSCLLSFCVHSRSIPLPSNRQHLSYGTCLEDKREDDQNCSVWCSVRQLCTVIHTHTSAGLLFLHVRFRFLLCVYLGFVFYVFFYVSLGHLVLSCIACFCCVGFSFFSTLPRNWLGRTSPK